MLNSSKPQSRTTYRSFRYSLNRESNVRTADPSSAAKFRIKKHSLLLESTMNRTGGFENSEMSQTLETGIDGHTTSYIKNFHSVMQSERKMSYLERREWKVKPLKYKIENFEELESSDFTLLDPFHRHFNAIQSSCKKVEEEMKNQSFEVKLISGELKNLNKRITSNLTDTERQVTTHLEKFTALLKENTIKQQETKLRFKQEIAILEIEHQENLEKSNQILERNLSLQQTIFNCEPYELRENQSWKDISECETTVGVRDGTLC